MPATQAVPHRRQWAGELSRAWMTERRLAPRDVLWQLTLDFRTIDGVGVLIVGGRISHATSAALSDALVRHLQSNRSLIVDISGVDYVSSAGFRALEQAAHRFEAQRVSLVLCGLQDAVRPAFDLAGPIPTLLVVPDRAAAIAAARTLGP